MPHHRYDNLTLDVVQSGILPRLTGRQRDVLLILAGLSRTDSQSDHARTCWLYHGTLGEWLGVSRQRASGYLIELQNIGVIRNEGAHTPYKRVKGQQPATKYFVADFNTLCRISDKYDRPAKNMHADTVRNLREGVHRDGQPLRDRVSTPPDNRLSTPPDNHYERVSTPPDTKREVLQKKGTEKSIGGLPSAPNVFANGNGNGHRKPTKQVKQYDSGIVPDRFFKGIAPDKLDYDTGIKLNDLMHMGTVEEKEWARATFQRLRNEAREEMIPLTFGKGE